jgi:hypothetical protein
MMTVLWNLCDLLSDVNISWRKAGAVVRSDLYYLKRSSLIIEWVARKFNAQGSCNCWIYSSIFFINLIQPVL